ncbi:MAG: iron ABC transporter permease [Phycisphaeraceae bacterium]|nr:iron ABC transporter permease [Phycisphaeraceae bacterium]
MIVAKSGSGPCAAEVRSFDVLSRRYAIIAVFGAGLVAVAWVRLLLGTEGLVWPRDPEVLALRWHRVALAAVCGGGLAVAGVLLQTFLRNPLASPDLTGVASGAGLGVLVASYLAFRGGQTLSPVMFGPAAVVGALVTLAIVGSLARRRGRGDPIALVLIGVCVGIVATSMGLLVQHLMPPDPARSAIRWMVGSLDEQMPGWVVALGAGVVACASLVVFRLGPSLDAASMSDEEAASVGVRVRALRVLMFVLAGLLTAVAVMLGGPIGFVGLVCPHLVRSLVGPSHRTLVVGTLLVGATMLIGADVVVRLVSLEYGRLPVGVVTALLGAPVLILMLRRGVGAWGG